MVRCNRSIGLTEKVTHKIRNISGEMASIAVEEIAPDVDSVFEASTTPKNKKKSKKPKKERKDKTKAKRAADILLEGGCHETVSFTQMHDCKRRKKSKKNKIKPKEDSQLLPPIRTPKSENQLKQSSSTHTGFTHQIHPVICISPDLSLKHSSKRGCLNRVKEVEIDKIRKRVVFNLPPEPSQATNTHVKPFTTRNAYHSATRAIYPGNLSQGKQLVGESSLESQTTAEEMSSQDLFITQKSYSEPNLNLSSSASGNDITIVSVQEEHSCRMAVDTATQTENFFTFPEVTNCLRFQQQQKTSTCTEEPMDLRLPRRARQVQRANQPAKHPVAICIGQPKLQISDTSSEDGDMVPKTKGELSQLKVIQTRLNESFFFKVKGYDSPKPVCPLMKLKNEKKTKK